MADTPLPYPAGFRARRGQNWLIIGLMYTSYYMCRYNFPIANKAIADEFHFNKEQMGSIITTAMLAYGCGQIINGLLTDRFGGKRAMLIGAAGTVLMNVLFGFASFWGLLPVFMMIRGLDQYMQAFGAPGMIKINTAWFSHTERGQFAGIFGFMINLGRFGIFNLGPALLAGGVVFGLLVVPPLHWRWLFWVPAGIATVVAICLALFVKDTPEEAGFAGVHAGEADHADTDVRASVAQVFKAIASTPAVWVCGLAYACTGVVRQGVDQWFPRYMQEVYAVDLKATKFQWLAFLIPFVASAGSLLSGYLSDKVFQGRRAPVAAGLYFFEAVIIFLAAQFHTVNATILFFVLIAFTANSTHSILGTAAAMDIGGRKMAGFASGLIDSFQYFGGALAGAILGKLLDKSWGNYFYFMAPFGVIGGLLMLTIIGKVSLKKESASKPAA